MRISLSAMSFIAACCLLYFEVNSIAESDFVTKFAIFQISKHRDTKTVGDDAVHIWYAYSQCENTDIEFVSQLDAYVCHSFKLWCFNSWYNNIK